MNTKKEKIIFARVDAKLYEQLKRYADREDDGMVSRSARRALKKFLEETEAAGLKNK